MWDIKEYDFKEVPAGTVLTHSFKYSGNKEVLEVEPLCNCINARFINNALSITWKTNKNVHNSYESVKVIMITYVDGSVDDITVKAKLMK